MTPEFLMALALFAIFIGAWIRILLPFFRKNLMGEDLDYSHKYTMIFVLTYVMAVVVTLFVYQTSPPDLNTPIADIFVDGLLAGFMSEAVIIEIAKLALPLGWWD